MVRPDSFPVKPALYSGFKRMNKFYRTSLLAKLTLAFLSLVAFPVAGAESDFEKQLKPFFEAHCIKCHGPKKEKGDVRLDEVPYEIKDGHDAERWQEILDVLNGAEMPPEDEPQPSTDELASAITGMTDELFEARKRLVDSETVTLRRLNKREYANTIRDLLGVPIDTASLPADGTLDGFDTIGDAQFMSVPQFEQYLALGRIALDRSLVAGPRPKQTINRVEPEKSANKKAEGSIQKGAEALAEKLAKMNDASLSKEDREVFKKGHARDQDRIQRSKAYLAQPGVHEGFILDITQVPFGGQSHDKAYASVPKPARSAGGNVSANLGNSIGRYVARFRAALTCEPKEGERLFVEVSRTNSFNMQSTYSYPLGVFEISSTMDQPQMFEIPFENLGEMNDKIAVRVSKLNRSPGRGPVPDSTKMPFVWIDWVEVEGPLVEQWPPKAWQETFFKGASVGKEEEESYAREVINRFVERAFRGRQASSEYLDKLHGIYRDHLNSGASFVNAVKESLAVVLASPGFVYLVEPGSPTDEKRKLSDLELASRLSYFLWSHPPDEELFHLAHAGKLSEPAVLQKQVNRMLKDPRSQHFTEAFISQWLELEWLDMIVVNKGTFPDFNESLRRSMRGEPVEMFREMVRNNLSLTRFIDSDFVMVDDILAKFYGLEKEASVGFQKVALPDDSPRGGLLGTGAVLTMTGTGERTSPVERGVFVYSHLLGRSTPPPPPNVPQLVVEDGSELTVRDLLEAHTSKAQCASCHRRMDPLGFGLEHFDAIGAWRDKEMIIDPSAPPRRRGKGTQLEIDASGVMPDRKRSFEGHEELKSYLLEDRDAMAEGFLKAMFTYGLGRRVGFADSDEVARMLKEWKADDHGMRSLIHLIVQSKEFQRK